MKVKIDENSGFCFGVVYAVEKAEKYLENNKSLFCLGDIVHNDVEISRLENRGLKIIQKKDLFDIKNEKILIRAHGEPPETYKIAKKNNINIIDASCPIVLKLQTKIRKTYLNMKLKDGQIVIFGKKGHAEIIGLSGHTNNEAIIVSSEEDLSKIDYSKPIALFSQTTKSSTSYYKIIEKIKKNLKTNDFTYLDSVCKQVANRDKSLKNFCAEKDIIIFISGKKSSNGQMLYNICKEQTENTKFVSEIDQIKPQWFKNVEIAGITGATSTPAWLLNKAKNVIEKMNLEN